MRKSLFCSMLLCMMLSFGLSGCYQTTILTEVQKDGTWRRTNTFTYAGNGDQSAKSVVNDLKPVFDLPKGAEWTVKEATVSRGKTYTAVRTLKAGDSLDHDVVIKNDKDATHSPLVVNSVKVREIAPGQLEYTEFFRWKGTMLDKDTAFQFGLAPDEVVKILQKYVPEGFLTEERRTSLAKNARYHMWTLVWASNDPLANYFLDSGILPDMMRYKIARRILEAWNEILGQTFGDAIPPAQRIEAARAITKSDVVALTKQSSSSSDQQQSDITASTAVPITVRLRLPGTVTETNGERDPLSDELYWVFYAPAAKAKDVVLRAVCKVDR